ncbi:DJ-1 family glyoxalase III [Leptospira interrogans]|uniref:DJ-1/PfpI family protein n=3 Tax=Leptospira interrogans TaxID=173 RepID=A0AAP9WAW8_LEPIR|nr:DJ-1 family glyoxalase III [Leptospira interrogans]EMF69970.1 DJ-1 family protein [Leptospira interrogans serovar Canicola str. LT1962]EKO23755.1 DJ-1 family protein [Leptospira interrogans str. UI 12621]EKR53199.1 DJ-1 family protein [Leptospira interrogans str. UI 12758]EMM90093.1 DJ-1 family protein [Leptospira interrogans serovar Djasiman str. LT1649]EMO93873.1 DJ-1 family protein [Leptospira interrogans str. UI 13372]
MPKVLVPFAEGMEEMEAVIIVDVLRRAGIEVLSASLKEGPVKASRGIRILADTTLDEINFEDFDMIVLPGGGGGTKVLSAEPKVSELLKNAKEKNKWIAAICAAPSILVHQNILTSKDRFTAFPGIISNNSGYTGSRLEVSGKIITSIGPGSAFEFALELVKILSGEESMLKVKSALQLAS